MHEAIGLMRVGALYNAKNFTDAHFLDDEHCELFWLHWEKELCTVYNYKNFTDAHSLDDELSDISEHGDFVWTVDPNNKPPSYEYSGMCFVHLTLLTRIWFERTHENVTYTSFVCLTKLIKTIIKIFFVGKDWSTPEK